MMMRKGPSHPLPAVSFPLENIATKLKGQSVASTNDLPAPRQMTERSMEFHHRKLSGKVDAGKAIGLKIAAGGFAFWAAMAAAQQSGAASPPETMEERIAVLENLAVRTQSHVMVDVEYHFSNLWFAAAKGQWELAGFYLREARSHLAWTVRMRPVRNISGGGTVELRPFEESIGTGFALIEARIGEQDIEGFKTAYTQTLPQCHACHVAAGLGYLEPHVPEQAPSTMMLKGQ